MNIFGNCACPLCGLETRFLMETEESEKMLLLGDSLEEGKTGTVECDYCQEEFKLHVVTVDGIVSAFLNEEQMKRHPRIKKANKDAGIVIEKTKKLKQFHESFTNDFKNHPFKKGEFFTINRKKWKIETIHKKENIESDPTKRIMGQVFDEYWYEVSYKNEKKWIIVQDAKENNALLAQDAPVLKENEKIYDVTENLHKTTLIITREMGENYILRAYNMLSGIRITVHSLNEGTEELEFDVIGETFEEALSHIEEVYSVSE